MESDILYRSTRAVKVGQLERYVITYEREEPLEDIDKISQNLNSLWLKVKNTEPLPMRAAFLMGPYILYVDVRTEDFDHNKTTFVTADQPSYDPNLSPGKSFIKELSLHTIKKKYVWIVDVISQIIFSPTIEVGFELIIGSNLECLDLKCSKLGSLNKNIVVNRRDTQDLWNLPKQVPNKETHLVFVSHGLHSNTGADMFYLKDELDKLSLESEENLIVRGYHGNACRTEKGVNFLGRAAAEHLVNDLYIGGITKISFIGHSLGGLVQTFMIAYIEVNYPWFFQKVKPVNFITLASPLLGIVTDNPAYVKLALTAGIVGRTGQDLGLEGIDNEEPLLKLLPTGPTHRALKRFKNRTVYANAVNDGIVPLYSAALLYLDWRSLSKLNKNISDEDKLKSNTVKIPNNLNENVSNDIAESDDNDMISKVTKNLIDPFQKAISLLGPNIQSQYTRSQTNQESTNTKADEKDPVLFPKSSMIESAASVLLPPLPPMRYIIDPNSRADVIIHDEIYTPSSIPKFEPKQRNFIQNLDPMAKFEELEDEIAREWHKGMNWRKVLVKLPPDAHNNIFVRRRFANAYGWKVVDHVLEHFINNYDMNNNSINIVSNLKDSSSVGNETGETEEKEHENEEDDNDDNDGQWVNIKYKESMFDVGPTGMISSFSEILKNFRKWNNSTTSTIDQVQIEKEIKQLEEMYNTENGYLI